MRKVHLKETERSPFVDDVKSVAVEWALGERFLPLIMHPNMALSLIVGPWWKGCFKTYI